MTIDSKSNSSSTATKGDTHNRHAENPQGVENAQVTIKPKTAQRKVSPASTAAEDTEPGRKPHAARSRPTSRGSKPRGQLSTPNRRPSRYLPQPQVKLPTGSKPSSPGSDCESQPMGHQVHQRHQERQGRRQGDPRDAPPTSQLRPETLTRRDCRLTNENQRTQCQR